MFLFPKIDMPEKLHALLLGIFDLLNRDCAPPQLIAGLFSRDTRISHAG